MELESIYLFTAYSITSGYVSKGLCVTTSGFPTAMTSTVSITGPSATNSTAFESSVTSLFHDRLGLSSCSGNGNQVEIDLENIYSASDLIQVANASDELPAIFPTVAALTPTNATIPSAITTVLSPTSDDGSSKSSIGPATETISSEFTRKDKAAIGVVVPAVAIIAFALGVIFYLRRRRNQSRSGEGTAGLDEEPRPYLQQKAELEAEGKRRLELEAAEIRHEMEGEDRRNEMPADVSNEIDTVAIPQMPSLKERHELRGEECSRELEAP